MINAGKVFYKDLSLEAQSLRPGAGAVPVVLASRTHHGRLECARIFLCGERSADVEIKWHHVIERLHHLPEGQIKSYSTTTPQKNIDRF
ncbi:hypothetical protein D3C77_578490 [compost metagenome]